MGNENWFYGTCAFIVAVVMSLAAFIAHERIEAMQALVKAGTDANDASCAIYGDDKSCNIAMARKQSGAK